MPKYAHPEIMDLGLSQLDTTATGVYAIQGFTTDFATATDNITGNAIGNAALITGDITLTNGNTAGARKAVVSDLITISFDKDGTPDHLALVDSLTSKVLYVTEIVNPQPVLLGNTMTTPVWEVEISAPV